MDKTTTTYALGVEVTHMVPDEGTCYLPNAEYMEIYDRMYERYKKFAELVHRTA